MSQAAVSQRPTMIIPGKESKEHVLAVWKQIQKEVKEVESFTIEYNENEVKVTVKFTLQGDNKERKQLTGNQLFFQNFISLANYQNIKISLVRVTIER